MSAPYPSQVEELMVRVTRLEQRIVALERAQAQPHFVSNFPPAMPVTGFHNHQPRLPLRDDLPAKQSDT